MSDITSQYLEAAIIDQNVAGTFHDRRYAFVSVYNEGGWQLGVAIANETGFNPIKGKTFKDRAEAKQWADGLNAHIGLTDQAAIEIITSTMGGKRVEVVG